MSEQKTPEDINRYKWNKDGMKIAENGKYIKAEEVFGQIEEFKQALVNQLCHFCDEFARRCAAQKPPPRLVQLAKTMPGELKIVK